MLKYIETHKSDISKTEDVYNEKGILLFTVQYTATKTEDESKYVIDYVRAHTELGSDCPLESYQKLCEEERLKNLPIQKEVVSPKELRETDPKWQECKKAARLLLKQGLKTQVKALLREYNKTKSLAES